ncbi:MAG: hypothetical protein GY846_24660 [Deltaproteobacteria bacterium]|nr:hypothetical protein [Deltaproteobacteria bacterium]
MTTRERIILVVMFLAVAYGIYALFLSSPSKITSSDTKGQETRLNTLIADVSEALKKETITEPDLHTIARAEAEWTNDPFYASKFSVLDEAGKTPGTIDAVFREGDLFYSGYLKMGEKKVAIINGVYYRIGNELEQGGYIVRDISPTRVRLKIKGKKEEITIPLVEDVP